MNVELFSYDDVLKMVPMRSAIEALRVAFREFDPNRTLLPQRQILNIGQDEFGTVMPAYSPALGFGVKLSTIMPRNPEEYGLNLIHSVYCSFCPQTGRFDSLIDGCALTNLRTGAISGLSVDILTDKQPKFLAIIGAGVQARFFYEAVNCVRDIKQIFIYSRTKSSAENLKKDLYENYGFCGSISICESPADAIKESNIVGTVTSTAESKGLVYADDLTDKAHICAIGGRTLTACEVDPKILKSCNVVVDNVGANLVESAELKEAIQKGYTKEEEILSLHQLLNKTDNEIAVLREKPSYFRSVGTALQDIVVAGLLRTSSKIETRIC